MSELDKTIEGIRRIHESVMSEFNPNTSIFDGLTEEEMWLLFLVLNQLRKEAENDKKAVLSNRRYAKTN